MYMYVQPILSGECLKRTINQTNKKQKKRKNKTNRHGSAEELTESSGHADSGVDHLVAHFALAGPATAEGG